MKKVKYVVKKNSTHVFIFSLKSMTSKVAKVLIYPLNYKQNLGKYLSTITEPKYMSEGPYSQLAEGEAL